VLLVEVLLGGLTGPSRARANAVPPAEVVAAVTDAYGTGGTVAVVIADLHIVDADLPPRAADARAARLTVRTAGNGLAAGRAFPSASLVKLFLAEDLLRRDRAGTITLTAQDRRNMAAMIRSSDDPAASALWVRHDGAGAVRSVAERYDLAATEPPRRAGQWGQTLTTAGDVARFLALLPVVAHPDDAATLLDWMRATTPIAADGFDQRFGFLGTVEGRPAVKQGWMCCVAGQRHLHSVAVTGTTVMVLLSEVPREVGYDRAGRRLDAAAGAAVGALHGGR
jgi:hypothetical protein